MTIQELYDYAKEAGLLTYDIGIYHGNGSTVVIPVTSVKDTIPRTRTVVLKLAPNVANEDS